MDNFKIMVWFMVTVIAFLVNTKIFGDNLKKNSGNKALLKNVILYALIILLEIRIFSYAIEVFNG